MSTTQWRCQGEYLKLIRKGGIALAIWYGLIPQVRHPINKEEYAQIRDIMNEWVKYKDEWNVALGAG